ncbi:hypothetical protein N9N28_01205 [Rubripirellula amarantea]|nr:hypothetical protein [Rubripirellula amarantea]
MAGDLEDFLRRAAQQRQAKAAQQRQAQQAPPPRLKPQYSNSRTERTVRSSVEPEEILVAEVIEDENSISARRRRVEQAKQRAKEAEQELARRTQKSSRGSSSQSDRSVASTGDPIADLLANLRRPGGVQQAILLREILDRPEHRW